ncbi:Fructose-2,6-bisphosphatase [Gordonia terrae C-6]|uniref:Fructose-2,6-bisphosphatase n=1 Tax=Gordonia terrae C-6 TaxID=1316928 RepID=R7YCB2_9ACTN|nr:histidine phosphatase family protein [Gordonia terrae]EON33627.1 Fructose-2,6-bisphosphatase [Gordonia terrae C-6]
MDIITAGRTGPNRSVRFGGDPVLDERGRSSVLRLAASVTRSVDTCGPEISTRETAELLGSTPDLVVDDALRTLDVGTWAGRTPEDIDPAELGGWFADPGARPHGGESVSDFVDRVHAWRAAQTRHGDRCVVVAMPVAQALLCTDAGRFFAHEVRPATLYTCADV